MKKMIIFLALAWTAMGIMQIRNPSPMIIFIDIIMILVLMYFIESFNNGWKESGDLCTRILEQNKELLEKLVSREDK